MEREVYDFEASYRSLIWQVVQGWRERRITRAQASEVLHYLQICTTVDDLVGLPHIDVELGMVTRLVNTTTETTR